MGAPYFIQLLDVLRERPGRRVRRFVFTDAARDRIAAAAQVELGARPSKESMGGALDVLERELAPFIMEPS